MGQESLFGDDEPVVVQPQIFLDIPQPLYDSWPRCKQLAYCAARDENSATRWGNEDMADWYRARAQSYREMM